jgi:hypothetical protein
MKHVNLSDQLGTLAGAIQSGQQTNTTPAGSISVPNADGTKTILGKAAGAAGVAPWVGDTTAPGVPTGVSASSTSGIVTVTWDGTLDGGVPEDFAYVTVLIDGVERGRLTHAGALPVDGLTVGAEVQVTATASDAARLEDGTLSPNVSAPCAPVSVTVASVVSQEELDAVAKTAADAKTAGDQAASDAAAAQGDATEAKTTASSALTVATGKITTGTGTPSASGHDTGDLYLQTDSSGHVINILVFNASSTWVPYILVASALLVASSVGTTQIADGAITTAKLVAACVTAAQIDAGAITTDKLAANSVTAAKVEASEALLEKLLVRKIVADDIDVGSLAAAIVTSTEFHTADGRLGFDSTNGFYAKDTSGNYVFKVDTTGKLTAVGAEISGTLSNVTPLSSTVINEDGVEIRGTGWKFPYPVSIPEPITSYLFASSDHYLAGITYDFRTLYQWHTPGGGLGTPTKITIPIGDPIKGLSWLGTSKYLVLRSKQSGSTVAWRVEVWNMSGAVQATYNLPSTDTSWYGAIAQYPDGSGFYVAMGNSSTTGTIYRYNSSGVLQKQWTLPVTDYYGGSTVQSMAVDSSGNLYISQAGNTRCYTPAGVEKWSLVGGFTSLMFDNIHSYLVEGIGQTVTWADPSTGNMVGATPVPELIQSLALMDFNGANLYVLSAIGPKIIVGEWSTPATEAGQSVVIDASSGISSFHNTIDVVSVISQYPMLQADGERVSGVHVASSISDLNGVPQTHLITGLSRGFIPKIASNQTDAGDYVWSGSAWVKVSGAQKVASGAVSFSVAKTDHSDPQTITFPSGLFTKTPFVTLTKASNTLWGFSAQVESLSTTSMSVRVACPQATFYPSESGTWQWRAVEDL